MGLFEIGMSAVAVLVVGWLVVSFSPPGPRRAVVEWIAAMAMYVALVSLFVNLSLEALEKDSTVGLVAFGFLTFLFGSGFLVSVYNVYNAVRDGGKAQTASTATN